ncbi:hypothetical protein [Vibrio pectenicida]|uniref:hypothetical protein n=1 Tax=Vibrio pectenicida TaxID=62763 RepID=UPI0030814CAF
MKNLKLDILSEVSGGGPDNIKSKFSLFSKVVGAFSSSKNTKSNNMQQEPIMVGVHLKSEYQTPTEIKAMHDGKFYTY